MTDEGPYAPFGNCDREGCDEPCPWDMACILFDQRLAFCSPECARVALDDMAGEDLPKAVKLHDPQGAINREELGVPPDSIDLIREVSGRTDIREVIDEMDEMMVGPWRVKGGPA